MKNDHSVREIVAYHEAGHAVITWVLKQPLYRIYISDFEGKVAGETAHLYALDPDFMSDSDWRKVKNEALILLAGESAERAYYELHELDCDEFLSSHDLRELSDMLIKFGEHVCPPVAMSKKALKDESDSLVVKHWNQIEALAKELMSKGEVQGPEAVLIIESTKLHE